MPGMGSHPRATSPASSGASSGSATPWRSTREPARPRITAWKCAWIASSVSRASLGSYRIARPPKYSPQLRDASPEGSLALFHFEQHLTRREEHDEYAEDHGWHQQHQEAAEGDLLGLVPGQPAVEPSPEPAQ